MPPSGPRWWHWTVVWLLAVGILLWLFLAPRAQNNAARRQFDTREVGVAARPIVLHWTMTLPTA